MLLKVNESMMISKTKPFREKFIVIQGFLKEKKRKISNKQPNLPPKRIRKRRTKKVQSWQKEGNHKVQR